MIRIHREGGRILPMSLSVLLLIVAGAYLVLYGAWAWLAHVVGAVAVGAGVVLVRFFRDPVRSAPGDVGAVLSPCDGRVVAIETVGEAGHFGGPVQQVSIFMSIHDVHVNRSPIGGRVLAAEYHAGRYLVAFHPKSSGLNEHTYLVVENAGLRVGFKQIAGFVARRIRCYVRAGDVVGAGQEFGFIRFGSRMDVLVPLGCTVRVGLGQRVRGGETVLAVL